jgi:peptide/nickel transport system permease protein
MQAYIIRRLLSGVVVLFLLSVIVFVMLRVVPGDQASLICGLNCDPEGLEQVREDFGLNDPYVVQYVNWIQDLLTGNLGNPAGNEQPLIETIQQRLPVTLELLIITVLFTVVIGIPAGVVSAIYRNSWGDYAVRIIAVLGLAIPTFWVATLVIYVPSELWAYSPPVGGAVDFFSDPWDNLRQFVPPAAVLAIASAAGIMRLTRSSLLEVMRTDYIRTARSKGLRESLVISRHALKNSMIPVITVLGLQVAGLLGGTVIIEVIFSLPGIGVLFYSSLLRKDYQVVQSLTLYVGAVVILMNLIVDISYAWLDPRIRYS